MTLMIIKITIIINHFTPDLTIISFTSQLVVFIENKLANNLEKIVMLKLCKTK